MHYQKERNYGCRVSDDWEFRGNKVAIIENEKIRVMVLVDKGADIYSFVHKPSDTDYMWRSVWGVRDTRKFLSTTGDISWGDTYEGGWQTCAPTAGNKRKDYQGAPMGQHSEMSTMPWDSQIIEDDPEKCSIKFSVRTYRTPFFMEKTLSSIFEKIFGLIICKPVNIYFKLLFVLLDIKSSSKLKSPLRFLSKLNFLFANKRILSNFFE